MTARTRSTTPAATTPTAGLLHTRCGRRAHREAKTPIPAQSFSDDSKPVKLSKTSPSACGRSAGGTSLTRTHASSTMAVASKEASGLEVRRRGVGGFGGRISGRMRRYRYLTRRGRPPQTPAPRCPTPSRSRPSAASRSSRSTRRSRQRLLWPFRPSSGEWGSAAGAASGGRGQGPIVAAQAADDWTQSFSSSRR